MRKSWQKKLTFTESMVLTDEELISYKKPKQTWRLKNEDRLAKMITVKAGSIYPITKDVWFNILLNANKQYI